MINHWLSPKEITKMKGMPSSIAGVHKKAKREKWQKRKQEGVKGPGVEYLVEPSDVISVQHSEPLRQEHTDEKLSFLYELLGDTNINKLIDILQRKGVDGVLLSEKARQIAMMVEELPTEYHQEILLLINEAQYCALTGLPFKPARLNDHIKRKSAG